MRDVSVKTLDKKLCQLADSVEEHARYLDLSHLLLQLWHHHVSQGKESVPPCSKHYNRELAERLAFHLGMRVHPPVVKYAGGQIDVARSEARRSREVRRQR